MQSDMDSLMMPITLSDRRTPVGKPIFEVVVPETPLEMQGMRQPLAFQGNVSPVECNPSYIAAPTADSSTLSPLGWFLDSYLRESF